MAELKSLEDVYCRCDENGEFNPKEIIDLEMIKSRKEMIDKEIDFISSKEPLLTKGSKEEDICWSGFGES